MTNENEIVICSMQPFFGVQVLTIFLGAVDMILAIDTILPWPDEQFFLAMTIIALVFSCVCALGDRLYVKESTKVVDMLIYSLVGAVLLISSFVMFFSAIKVTDLAGYIIIERAFAASIGICNGTTFCYLGFTLVQELQNSIFPITHTQNRLVFVDWDRLKVTKAAGKLQVLAIVLGAVDLGITAHSYFRYSEEAIFLSIVIICFALSVLELVGNLLGIVVTKDYSSYVVLIVAHAIGSILLVSGGILMIIAVVLKNDGSECGLYCSFSTFDERLVSGILGIINGLVYGAVSYCWYLKSRTKIDTSVYDWDYEDLEPLINPEPKEENSNPGVPPLLKKIEDSLTRMKPGTCTTTLPS